MLQIHCPFCGARDHSEFAYGKDASVAYPPLDASADAWHDAVFMRENIRGVQSETWQHIHGCRQYLIVERDTVTHRIHSVRAAHPGVATVLAGDGDGDGASDGDGDGAGDGAGDSIDNRNGDSTVTDIS